MVPIRLEVSKLALLETLFRFLHRSRIMLIKEIVFLEKAWDNLVKQKRGDFSIRPNVLPRGSECDWVYPD